MRNIYACSVTQSCLTLCDRHGLYVACQASLSMGLPWQKYWSGLSFPPLGDLLDHRYQTCDSCGPCIGRWILYPVAAWEAPNKE